MKLTQEEKRIKIAEACGVTPLLERWCAYKDDGDGGSICMSGETRQEVENWLEALPEGSWAKEYYPKAIYRYPSYFNDLNALYGAWESLTDDQKTIFASHIRRLHEGMDIRVFAAFKHHGAECIGLTLNLWEAGA